MCSKVCSGFCALPSWSGWRCAWRSFGHYFELLSGTDQRQLEIIKLRVFVQRVAPYSDQSHPARAAPRVAMAPGSGRLHCVSWPDRARRACQRQPQPAPRLLGPFYRRGRPLCTAQRFYVATATALRRPNPWRGDGLGGVSGIDRGLNTAALRPGHRG